MRFSLKELLKFGSAKLAAPSDLDRIVQCISQSIGQLDWLEPLRRHSEGKLPSKWAAIGFDTNALKQLRRLPAATRTSILTYLQGESVPIILPAQAVQEYWNNHGVFTKDVQNLESDTRKLAGRFERLQGGPASKAVLDRIASQVNVLAADLADSQNVNLLKESVELWDLLYPTSVVAHAPRMQILELGEARFLSGIAPGFADESKKANRLGDFFVWVDFLVGLLKVLGASTGKPVDESVIFVTEDGKEDWIATGVPHPTLLGEVFHLTGRTLQIMSMNDLNAIVAP